MGNPDTLIFSFINRDLQNTLFDVTMPFITDKPYLLFLPFLGWFFLKGRKKALIVMALGFASLALSDWTSDILKHIFERPRPCNVLEGVHLLVGCSSSYSMPSSHASNVFSFGIPFFIFFKNRARYALLIVALLVALSRVYVGVHYPSDVIAGGLLGLVSAVTVVGIYNWANNRSKERPYTTVLLIFLFVLSLFRIYYIQSGPLDLSPDEAHYWEWSRRLDVSYYSKGPMIAYLIYLGTALLGDTVFGIRLMAVIFSALSSVCMYYLGKKLFDEQVGLFSALLIQLIPLFSTYGIVFTIDSPLIFFWVLSLLLFWKALTTQQSTLETKSKESGVESQEGKDTPLTTHHSGLHSWVILGLSVGVGLLTKYTMAFFSLCAFLFLLFSKEDRRLLLTKKPYIAFITSLLVFSPVIVWNAGHDWVTFRHTAGQAHVAEGMVISLKSFFEFFGSQLGVITPLLFILMVIAFWRLRNQKEGVFLFWFAVPVIVFFLLKSLQGKVQANWALPGYITGIIVFSGFYKTFYSEGRGKKILIITALLLSVIVTSVAHYPSILNLPVKKDPTSRLRGWEVLGSEVTKIYDRMSGARPVFIFSDRYQVSSELAFYVKGHPVTYCVNLGRRMNQYDFWPGVTTLLHYDAIFVRIGDTQLPVKVANAFQRVEKTVFTAYTGKHKKIRDYSLFLCHDFRGMKEERPRRY